MKRCPLCSGVYPDEEIYCGSCGIKLVDKEKFYRASHKSINKYKTIMPVYEGEIRIKEKIESMDIKSIHLSQHPQVSCPKCGCTQISANKRGWSLLTGFIGSNQVINTCMNCGHEWKPGKR